jgi:hypothetical protein
VGAWIAQSVPAAQLAGTLLLRARVFEVGADFDPDGSIVGARVAGDLDAGSRTVVSLAAAVRGFCTCVYGMEYSSSSQRASWVSRSPRLRLLVRVARRSTQFGALRTLWEADRSQQDPAGEYNGGRAPLYGRSRNANIRMALRRGCVRERHWLHG